jgi:hypothetical protein
MQPAQYSDFPRISGVGEKSRRSFFDGVARALSGASEAESARD